jgi:hypothetical protein
MQAPLAVVPGARVRARVANQHARRARSCLIDVGLDDRISRNRLRAGIHAVRADWRFGGDLAWLAGARQLLSLGLSRADITFGE